MAGCDDYTDKAHRSACRRWLNWNQRTLDYLQRVIDKTPSDCSVFEPMQAEAARLVARIAELEA